MEEVIAKIDSTIKRWQLLLGIIIMILMGGINLGYNLNRMANIEAQIISMHARVEKLELKNEDIIEMKIDLRYIKQELIDLNNILKVYNNESK